MPPNILFELLAQEYHRFRDVSRDQALFRAREDRGDLIISPRRIEMCRNRSVSDDVGCRH